MADYGDMSAGNRKHFQTCKAGETGKKEESKELVGKMRQGCDTVWEKWSYLSSENSEALYGGLRRGQEMEVEDRGESKESHVYWIIFKGITDEKIEVEGH